MAQKAVIDAVSARLAALWNRCPVFDPNTIGSPPADGSPFLLLQYPVTNSDQISIGAPGANWWRDEGVFRGVIHLPVGAGIATAAIWADDFAAIFRGKQFDGVVCWAPSASAIADDNDEAGYFVRSVAVPFWFDYLA